MKHTAFLSPEVVAEVERRAATEGRPTDLEYGRLLALGLLAKLAEELSPLFPDLAPQCNDPGRLARVAKRAVRRPALAPTLAAGAPHAGAGRSGTG